MVTRARDTLGPLGVEEGNRERRTLEQKELFFPGYMASWGNLFRCKWF